MTDTRQMKLPLPDVISVREAARILDLSQRQTLRLAENDHVEAKFLGKQWAFSKASVEEYKKAREARLKNKLH